MENYHFGSNDVYGSYMRFRREQIMASVGSRKGFIPLFSKIVVNKITLADIV